MISTRRCAGFLMGLALVSLVSCEKKQTSADAGIEGFLRSTTYSQGGLEQLKTASSFSATYDATLLGIKGGKVYHRPGMLRIEYTGPTRDAVVQVASEKSCWQSIGMVVLPCLEPLRAHTAHLSQLLEASWLWPLAGRKDRQIKIERGQPGASGGKGASGKEQLKLAIAGGGGEPIGSLLVDGETSQVVGLEMQTTLGGRTGAFVGTFGAFEKTCGISLATERRTTFLGQPFATEKLGGVICEKLDDKLFVQPEQVKHGTMEPKVMASNGLICTKLKGALSGVDAALATVMAQAQKKELRVTGAAVLIHRKGPPQVTRPEQYVTDVCLPVDNQAWMKLEASKWTEGAFFLGELADQRVLAAYGIGDLQKTTAELPKLLVEEAKKRLFEAAFPLYQIVYTRAADFPPERRVSEMHLPYVN
jgi:hypothetical protein